MISENKSSDNVFINCPFDDLYRDRMFDAVIFTIMDCGFIPRSALESIDSSEIRLEKIYKLIGDSNYGIHDISRVELDKENNLPRFNMPLELGIFLGAKKFGFLEHKLKKCLIIDREKYRYQKYLSDLSGVDIHEHNDDPELIIERIRNWLKASSGRKNIPPTNSIIQKYYRFKKNLPDIIQKLNLDPKKIIYPDLVSIMADWLRESDIL